MGLVTPPEGIIAPRELPDGRVVWEDPGSDAGDVVAKLRAYDPRCSLVRNVVDGTWEIHRKCEDGVTRRIGSHAGDRVPNGDRLVEQLAAHDTRKGYDPIADIDKHNAAVDRAEERAFEDFVEDRADKLHFYMKKDLGGLA